MKTITLDQYRSMNRERGAKGLGGSHVAPLMGVLKYSSPFSLWKGCLFGRKYTETVYTKRGKDNEAELIELFLSKNKRYTMDISFDKELFYLHSKYDYLLAKPDGILIDNITGEQVLLEIKTANFSLVESWNNGVPDSYYWQLLHYMNVTGITKGIFFVQFFDEEQNKMNTKQVELFSSDIPQIEGDREELLYSCIAFWEDNVVKCIPPFIDYTEATAEAIKELKLDDELEIADSFEKDIDHINSICKLNDKIKMLDKENKKTKQLINNYISKSLSEYGKRETENFNITYSQTTTNRFNSKKFKEENEKLYKDYKEASTSSRLTITRKK